MGMFDFIKEAGEKLFGGDDDKDDKRPPVRTLEDAQADKKTREGLTTLIGGMGFEVEDLEVKFRDGKATLAGKVPSQEVREKIILLAGNTQGVARVEDHFEIEKPEPEATLYTVKSGDTLGVISRQHYGSAGKYMIIFDANQPMLKDPNKIYPGQVLRIPPLSDN